MPNDTPTETPVSVDFIESSLQQLQSEFEQAIDGEPIAEGFLNRLESCCQHIQNLVFDKLSGDEVSRLEKVLISIQNLSGIVEQQKQIIEKNIDAAKNQKKVKSAYSI